MSVVVTNSDQVPELKICLVPPVIQLRPNMINESVVQSVFLYNAFKVVVAQSSQNQDPTLQPTPLKPTNSLPEGVAWNNRVSVNGA